MRGTLSELARFGSFAGIRAGDDRKVIQDVVGGAVDVADFWRDGSRLPPYRLGWYTFGDVELHCVAETSDAPYLVGPIIVRPPDRGSPFDGGGLFDFDCDGLYYGQPYDEAMSILRARYDVRTVSHYITELTIHCLNGITNVLFKTNDDDEEFIFYREGTCLYSFETPNTRPLVPL